MLTIKQLLLWCFICGSISFTHEAPSAEIENETNDLAVDLENWMAKLPSNIRRKPINYIAIPGSHDSFTSDISKYSDIAPDGVKILQKLRRLKLVKTVVANWAKTQAYNVVQQLQAGIRFFDLRFCRRNVNNNLHFCHSMFSSEVRIVLNSMAAYLRSHPKEVVILDCQHFYNFTSQTHTEVIQLFKDTFGNMLIPYQPNMKSLTLENLASQRKQVLVVYRDASQKGQAVLWPSESFPTPWYNTMDPNYLITSLNTGLKKRSLSTGYISQLVLTPSVEDYIKLVRSTLRQKCAVDFQNARLQWISHHGQGIVNVVIGDFVDLNNNLFSKSVINLNAQRSSYDWLSNTGIAVLVKQYLTSFMELLYSPDITSSS